METNKKANYSVLEHLEDVQNQIDILKKQETGLKKELQEKYSKQTLSLYAEKGDKFGVVNIKDAGFKLSFTTPKKVSYDQEGLKKLYDLGAPVTVEYSLSENVYKALDKEGQAAFMPYRTVEPGNVSIKIERG